MATVVVIGIVAWLIVVVARGIPRSFDELARMNLIGLLLENGQDGSFLVVKHKGSKAFVQFRVYGGSRKIQGLEFAFPNAKWSARYFVLLKSYCEGNNIRYSSQTGSDGMEFLCIDFKEDTSAAFDILRVVVYEIFELPDDARFYYRLENFPETGTARKTT